MWTRANIRPPLALILGGAAIVLTTSIAPAPRAASDAVSVQRVRILEARVAQLESRLLAMEQRLETSAGSIRQRSVGALPPVEPGHCSPAYFYDADGNKVLLAGCESSVREPCDPPLVADASGHQRLRPGCRTVVQRRTRRSAPPVVDRLGF